MDRDDLNEDIPTEQRDALLKIADGAVVTSGGFALQRVLVAATEFLLVQGLGPILYGVYALVWRLSQLLLRLVNFGTVGTLQRYVPAYAGEPSRRQRVAGLAYLTTGLVGIAIGVALLVGAEQINAATVENPAFPPAARLFALVVALIGFVQIHAALLRAMGSAAGEVIFNRILRPAVRLVGAAVALAMGYSLVGVAGAFATGMAALVVVGFPLVRSVSGVSPSLRGSRAEARQFYNHATPLALSSLGKVFQSRIDIVLIGLLLSTASTGVYSVVLVLISITWIPLRSFNQLLPSVASELYSNDQMDHLNEVYTVVTRLLVTTVLPLVSIQVVFGRELLSVFGQTYVAGYVPLVVYLGAVVVGSAVGATGWLLMMTDHQYARMTLDWLLAGTNIALTYLFVRQFGLPGAALGTAMAICLQNSIQVVMLRRFEGLWPFDSSFLRPIAAAVVMTGVMAAVRTAADGPGAVGLGLLVGLAVYVGTLLTLGVSPRDRIVVRSLAARYRRRIRSVGAARTSD